MTVFVVTISQNKLSQYNNNTPPPNVRPVLTVISTAASPDTNSTTDADIIFIRHFITAIP